MTAQWPTRDDSSQRAGHPDGIETWAEQGGVVPLARGETLKQRVSAQIRSALVDGILPPGSQLTVARVARVLGVSATPVREALMHLQEAGLVSFRDGKIIIPDATPETLEEAFELREALEGMSARLAAKRRTTSELRLIESHARRSLERATAGDLAGFCIADSAFHRAIAESARSRQLARYVTNALDLAFTLRNMRSVNRAFDARSAYMHQTIAEAIADSDSDLAEQIMREHVRAVLQQTAY